MSGIIVILVFCSGGLSAGVLQIARRRARRDQFTRDWVEYLKEDLAGSSL